MKIDLEVLASTEIKRRKPWPRIIWIGEEQESLLLLDSKGHRLSVLYVPSGKTKKKLPKLSPLVDQIVTFSHTKNGRFLLGLLSSGSLFVWLKDKDILRIIPGLQNLAPDLLTEKCLISASDDCYHVFVAVGTSQFFVWELMQGESIVLEQAIELKGTWHRVTVPAEMELPTSDKDECCRAAVFYNSPVFGDCCQFSMVYNKPAMLSISTVLLRFPRPAEAFRNTHFPKFSSEWSLLEYPFQQMHPTFEPLNSFGSYVASYAASGQVLAVAANQRQPSQTAMLFVSPLTDTVLVSSMKGCGTSSPDKTGSQYWVTDLAWTSDSLFVVCMLRNGSVCLVPRLGEPVVIQTRGCSVDMGPSRFLALHPAFFIGGDPGPSSADQNPGQQQFSLATHPTLPIMLFSDGFLVTVIQLPDDMTCVSLMRDYVLESAKYLKKLYKQENLDMTVADAYKLSKGQKVNSKPSKKAFEFEFAELTLNSTRGSEASMLDDSRFGMDNLGAFGNMDSGKIVFGEPEMITLNLDTTFSGLEASEALLKYLEESMTVLVTTWKLAVSFCDMWTAEVDNIAKQTIHNLTKIFSVVLDCPAVEAIIPVLTPRQSSSVQNPRVYNVIVAYRNVFQLLRFDTFNQHLIPATLRLVHKTVTLMLTSKELDITDPRLKTLFGCFSLIKHAEASLNRTYTWVPTVSQTASLSPFTSTQQGFEPAVMVKTQKQSTLNSSTGQAGVKLNQQEQLPGKRLFVTWKLLYKYLLQHQTSLSKAGDPSGELEHLNKLMYTVQQTLQESDGEITPKRTSAKLTSAWLNHSLPFELLSEKDQFSELEAKLGEFKPQRDKLSVDGEHTQAVLAWKEQLRELAESGADNSKTARMLHSVLYTHLLKGELGQAVEFVDSLILQASINNALSSEDIQALDDGQRPPMMTLVTHTLRSQDSNEEELVPCIKNKSIRQTVQTMARYMAAYFSNQTMFIYPPHNSQPLPSIHTGNIPTKTRIIPKYHEDVSSVIRREELSSIWTTERTVEYLLLSGLICETAWFAHKMGDWKTAFLLSVAHFQHREMAPPLYVKPKKPLQLPETLTPQSILKEKLQVLIQSSSTSTASSPVSKAKQQKRYFIPINEETDLPQMTRTLQDILTAGIICQVELSPWLLSGLVDKLKMVVSNLPSLVPQDFYLPSPPLYCPQPARLETEVEPPDVEFEKQLRTEISSIIQLILVAFNASRLSLHTARWYIQDLFKMQDRASQFKATTEGPCLELPEILQQYKIFRSSITDYKDNEHVFEVMGSFRDFCSILWLLHARDELSMHLRKRGSHLSNEKKEVKENTSSTLGQEWVQECFKTLRWAVHLLPFTQYLQDEGSVHKVVLSLLLELPATEDTADILAEHFYNAETLHAEVQEKLERILSSWQSVEILPEDDGKSAKPDEDENEDEGDDDGEVRKSVTFYDASPKAKTLSVYFHKQCEVIPRVLKKKRKCFGLYEEFVFNPNQENENTLYSSIPSQNGSSKIFIGSRPFETKQSYLEFLDRFYAICFSKVVEKESEQGRAPMYALLMPFVAEIRDKEFQTFLKKYEDTFQKRHNSVVLSSPRVKFFRSQSESHVHDESEVKQSMYGSQRGRGLFRSSSSGDVQPTGPYYTGMARYESEGALQGRKNSPGRGDKQRVPHSPTRGKANMTGMASRFFQSEEVLYRDPGESQDAQWILDVNFGHRYMALQQMLDWLSQWGSKQHSLGLHGKRERELGLKPTMRIEVPTQLVVLALWLLEHKYSPAKQRAAQKHLQQQLAEREREIPQTAQAKSKPLATLEEVTEHESFTNVSNPPQRSRSHSPFEQRSRSQSPPEKDPSRNKTLESMRSMTSEMEETEQVQSAYQKVLNGGDDSSSLEVSSLGSDEYEGELRNLSLLRSKGSRKGRSPRRRSSPHQSHDSPNSRENSTLNYTLPFATSPERGTSNKPPQTSTPLRNNQHQQSNRLNDMDQNDISRISVPPTGNPGHSAPLLGKNPSQNQNNNSAGLGNTAPPGGNPEQQGQVIAANQEPNLAGMDLAQQLQQIVRGELRRMMEVQHQSMMAMMGALDGGNVPVAWPATSQTPAQPNIQVTAQGLGETQNTRQKHRRSRSPQNKSIRGVLGELKNLQQTSKDDRDHKGHRSQFQGKENVDNTLNMSELQGPNSQTEHVELYRVTQQDPNSINFIPKFLRVPAEKDTGNRPVRFPIIPSEAWTSQRDSRPADNIPSMPLLHVERTVPGHIFPKSTRQPFPYFSQPSSQGYPPPPNAAPAPPGMVDRVQTESPDSGIGIPLLKIPTVNDPPRRPVFGELLPPNVVIGSDSQLNEQEKLRQRYDREFRQLQLEKREELEKKRFGDNLLHIDFEAQEMAQKEMDRRLTHQILKAQEELRTTSPTGKRTPRTPKQKKKTVTPRSPKRKEPIKKTEDGDEIKTEAESQKKEEEPVEEEEESPVVEEETGEDMEAESEEESEEEEIHDGYAIKPGEFESYLDLQRELGAATDTHAKIQLLTALKLQQQRVKRKKVDFATMTQEQIDAFTEADEEIEREGVRTSEKATSITKDTGVDPIHEAVIEYNKSHQPKVLPPDIYMGLRFAESDGQQPSSDITGQPQSSRGRSYINVVDLDASAIMRDIHEAAKEEAEPGVEPSLPSTQAHLRDRMAYEENLRSSLEPVIERPTRADQLTVKMFETRAQGQDRMSIAIMPRESLPDSKADVILRLREMNQQLAAIDRMSNNMEQDFKHTKLTLHTLEQMSAAMEPPTKDEVEEVLEERGLSPVPETSTPTPKISDKSPSVSARATARSLKSAATVEEKQKLSTELAKLSGLSGISDIIGDMVAKGEIDLEDAGLTQAEADHLVQRGAIRQEDVDDVKVGLNDIKKLATVSQETGSIAVREDLHEWMVSRRAQQMEEYKKHLQELREREVKPFKAEAFDQTMTGKELQAAEEERQGTRKAKKKEFMTKRLGDAQRLLGNILSDKPELPQEPPPTKMTPKKKSTPVKEKPKMKKAFEKMKVTIPSYVKKPAGILKVQKPPVEQAYDMPPYSNYLDDEMMLPYDEVPVSQPREPAPRKIQVAPIPEVSPVKAEKPPRPLGGIVPRLKLSLDSVEEEPRFQQTAETTGTGDLSAYARAMEAMEVESQDRSKDALAPEEPEEQPRKPYKFKPYTEIVKVQRPHVTRKQPMKLTEPYEGYLSSPRESEPPSVKEPTQREKEMIYGSKRIPGVKKPTEMTPRHVKTYTERLQEMKGKKTFSTPVAPRSHLGGSSVVSVSARPSSRPVKPKHKPVTYVQQLQKLNAGTKKPKMTKTTVIQKPMMKAHKPLHKPKTYAQQLQELQPPSQLGPPRRQVQKPAGMRTVGRQRPYKDPYQALSHEDYDQWERDSVVSAWSMGSDVRQILYDDAASSVMVGQSVDYAPSEQVSDYYEVVMGESYTASVDIDEIARIADAASVSSGSMVSVIDWDQVEYLIADVS